MERPKRKEHSVAPVNTARPSKRQKLEDAEEGSEDKEDPKEASSTSGSGSKSSMGMTVEEELNEIDRMEGRIDLEKYRFTIVKYMPNPALIQNETCEEWNVPNTTRQRDLIDHVEKKFVSVEIGEDLDDKKKKFLEKAVDIQEQTSMVLVMPISVNIKFLRLTLVPIGRSILVRKEGI